MKNPKLRYLLWTLLALLTLLNLLRDYSVL